MIAEGQWEPIHLLGRCNLPAPYHHRTPSDRLSVHYYMLQKVQFADFKAGVVLVADGAILVYTASRLWTGSLYLHKGPSV